MTKEHASDMTRMERCIELIEQVNAHPHKKEVMELAKEQLTDMYSEIGRPSIFYDS